jgi:hypothetical protein
MGCGVTGWDAGLALAFLCMGAWLGSLLEKRATRALNHLIPKRVRPVGGHCPVCRAQFNPDGRYIGEAECPTCSAPQQLPVQWSPPPRLEDHPFKLDPDYEDDDCYICGKVRAAHSSDPDAP